MLLPAGMILGGKLILTQFKLESPVPDLGLPTALLGVLFLLLAEVKAPKIPIHRYIYHPFYV